MNQPITRVLLCALAGSCFVLSTRSQVLNWGPDLNVNTVGEGHMRPRIVINADNEPVVLWGNMTDMHNYVSVGNGGAFTSPTSIHPSPTMAAMADWMGADLSAEGNSLWAVFKASPEMTNPMYAVNSMDGGLTWGDTMRIDPANDVWSRFPSVSTGPTDGPVVQYMQFDSGFANARYVVSRMNGGVFQPGVQVSTPFAPGLVCDCCPGQVVAEGDDVVALYRNNGSNVRTIWGSSSEDGAATFPTGAELDPTAWVIFACPSSGPDGYMAGDSIRYVWMSGAVSGSKVYLGSAHLPDLSVGSGDRIYGLAATVQQNFPRIAGNADTLGVVWQQTVGGNADVLFSWSVTGVTGLSEPDTVNTMLMGQQKTPDVAYTNGVFHITWSDQDAGVIRYRTASITSTLALPEAVATPALKAWPTPAVDQLFIDAQALHPISFSLVDESGRMILEAPGIARSLDLHAVPPGAYRLLAVDASGRSMAACTVMVAR